MIARRPTPPAPDVLCAIMTIGPNNAPTISVATTSISKKVTR